MKKTPLEVNHTYFSSFTSSSEVPILHNFTYYHSSTFSSDKTDKVKLIYFLLAFLDFFADFFLRFFLAQLISLVFLVISTFT